MHPEKLRLYQIQNGRLSAIIYFNMPVVILSLNLTFRRLSLLGIIIVLSLDFSPGLGLGE